MIFHFDTETFLIQPGQQAPPMVCLQFRLDDEPKGTLIHAKDPACKATLEWALQKEISDGHNVSYDAAVICASFPDLIPLVFDAYAADRIACTMVREKLIDLSKGQLGKAKKGKENRYSLAATLRNYQAPFELNKFDPWRLKYGTLYDVELEQWPQDAKSYALFDAKAQQYVYGAQEEHKAILADQYRQSRAQFWLYLSQCHGILTNLERVRAYHVEVLKALREAREVAEHRGLVRPDGTRNTKVAMLRMIEAYEALGETPPLTAGGEEKAQELDSKGIELSPKEIFEQFGKFIELSEDACLGSRDPALLAYQQYGATNTILGRVERLYYGTKTPLQPYFDGLKETGRTSCRAGELPDPGKTVPTAYGYQMQNLPRKGSIRSCFMPRKGKAFLWSDYSSKELCSWAQVCIYALGRSRLAEVLNAGKDPHSDLGATLAGYSAKFAEEIMSGEHGKDKKKEFKDTFRQSAKIANFGYPGGMGPRTLAQSARVSYRVDMTVAQAKRIKYAWLQNWPEAELYFDWINYLRKDSEYVKVKHFLSDRIRLTNFYCVTCNTFFQGLAADSAKDAGFQISKECYAVPSSPLFGARIVDFIHDEFLLEVDRERAHEAGTRLAQLMVERARVWMPDVKISAVPVLGYTWSKDAEPTFRNGELIPWEEAT